MPSRTLPGLGLTGFWDLHSDGWKDGMDANLRLLSALSQLVVISRTTTLPGSPANGDIYIVPAGAGSNPNKIAVRDNGAWVYITPLTGWRAYVSGSSEHVVFNGTVWAVLSGGSGGGSSNLVGITAGRLAADFTVTSGAWRNPTSWSIDRDNLSAYASNSDFTVPSSAALCRVSLHTAWVSGGAIVYTQAYDTTDNTPYCGDIRDRNNEAFSSATGPLIACTPGRTIRIQYNSGSASGAIAGASGSTFGKPTRMQIEWYSGWPA